MIWLRGEGDYKMFVDESKLPRGEMIVRGSVCFPEYKQSGQFHFLPGCLLVGGYHVGRREFYVFGELEFENFRNEEVYEFFKKSPTTKFYCGQSKDIIKRYRREINFAAGLSGVDPTIVRYDCLDPTQSRYTVFGRLHNDELIYKDNGVVFKGLSRFSVAKNDFPPSMKALVSLLNGIERNLYNDERFTAII
jgi:hypothetical protein